ncbi:MAG TPA: TolC family protein [Vicinamibacterales bacterium]|nr:TolC family protein [Vicinamibacterales bacterium]
MSRRVCGTAIACAYVLSPLVGMAQAPITVRDVVQRALQSYAAVDVSQEQVGAAAAAIRLARTSYLPRLDTIGQINQATRNNVFGLLLPQGVLPSISGPVLGTNTTETVWGAAIGVLVSWEPFDFGLRSANVAAAAASRTRAEAALKRTQFDVAAQTLDAVLTLAAARATVTAAQAGVDRGEVLVQRVEALVNAELRPGAEASRARAEAAAARTQLIQAQQAVAIAQATMTQFVGGNAPDVTVRIPTALPTAQPAPLVTANVPVAREQQSVVEQTAAELRALGRTYFPRVALQGAAYARGADGETVQNYAAGLTVTFPLFDAASIHARQAERAATLRAEEARARQIATDLRARWSAAVAALDGARRIAANTPIELDAARAAVDQARARYQAGLGPLVDLADAQRLLTSAEIDTALAQLNVWRRLLAVAAASGDLEPFIATFDSSS